MQQSSATTSLHLSFWGLRKIVACSHSSSQCLLVSTVFGTVSSLHPTSFLMIFILVNIVLHNESACPDSVPFFTPRKMAWELLFQGAVAGLLGLLLYIYLRYRQYSRQNLPPERSGWIPWLGCALEFGN